MRVSNHYMVHIVLGILAALVAGAVLAFVVMKHLRKKKKGELLLGALKQKKRQIESNPCAMVKGRKGNGKNNCQLYAQKLRSLYFGTAAAGYTES